MFSKKYVGGAKKTNNIRFSWDDRPFTETEENWTLSKVDVYIDLVPQKKFNHFINF